MTRFSALPNWAARLILVCMAAAVILAAVLKPVPQLVHLGPPGVSDASLYRAIADRVAHGENYYAAAVAQHRLFSYPTTPPEVFRQPTLAWLLAPGNDFTRRLAIIALSIVTFFSLRAALARIAIDSPIRVFALPLIGTGLAVAWTPVSAYLHEAWASLFIALSLSCYRLDRRRSSIALAFVACLFRELALGYVIAMAAFAAYERRYRELAGWFAVTALFLCLYAWHLSIAAGLPRPGDYISASWLYFGGWSFALEAAKRNLALIYLPNPAVAAAVCIAIVGLVGFRDAWVARIALIVGGYLTAFLFAGRPDNSYWGILISPLLPIGVALSPLCLRDVITRAWSPRPVPHIVHVIARRSMGWWRAWAIRWSTVRGG